MLKGNKLFLSLQIIPVHWQFLSSMYIIMHAVMLLYLFYLLMLTLFWGDTLNSNNQICSYSTLHLTYNQIRYSVLISGLLAYLLITTWAVNEGKGYSVIALS